MKIRYIGFVFCLTLIFLSCNKEENRDPLNGTWVLKNISGGFQGVDIDFAGAGISWGFNSEDKSLIVINSYEGTGYSGLSSGTYAYTLLDENDKQYVQIGDFVGGSFKIEGTKITIDENMILGGSGADGFIFTLEKFLPE